MKVRKAPHCSYRIRYHMVFVIRYRKRLITTEIFKLMKEICKGIEKRYYLWFDTLVYEENHVHVVIEGTPRYAPSRIM